MENCPFIIHINLRQRKMGIFLIWHETCLNISLGEGRMQILTQKNVYKMVINNDGYLQPLTVEEETRLHT